ncbi:MAG: hypothetical protein INF91_05610 [Alphaproteobacteria bacterium]|nr:hypothetical protein [Alphaproteobacteria bacterium]
MPETISESWSGSAGTTVNFRAVNGSDELRRWRLVGAISTPLAAGQPKLDGAGVIQNTTSGGVSVGQVEVDHADHYAEVTIPAAGITTTNYIYPAVRVGIDGANSIFLIPGSTTASVTLRKSVNGVLSTVAASVAITGGAPAAGDRLRLTVNGTTVTMSIARAASPTSYTAIGTSYTVADASVQGITLAGFYCNASASPAARGGAWRAGPNGTGTIFSCRSLIRRLFAANFVDGYHDWTGIGGWWQAATPPVAGNIQWRLLEESSPGSATFAAKTGYGWGETSWLVAPTVTNNGDGTGTWTGGSIRLPLNQQRLCIEFRDSLSGATWRSQPFCVGWRIAYIGQSLAANMQTTTDGTPPSLTDPRFFFNAGFGGTTLYLSSLAVTGHRYLFGQLAANSLVPLELINMAIGGTNSVQWLPGTGTDYKTGAGVCWWDTGEGAYMAKVANSLNGTPPATAGANDVVDWANTAFRNVTGFILDQGQGEADATVWGNNWTTVFNRLAEMFGQPRDKLLIILRPLGRLNTATTGSPTPSQVSDATWLAKRLRMKQFIDDDQALGRPTYLAPQTIDMPMIVNDVYHLTQAGYRDMNLRDGLFLARLAGANVADAAGPRITQVTRSGATVTVRIDLRGHSTVQLATGSGVPSDLIVQTQAGAGLTVSSCSIGAASGGFQDVTLTLSADPGTGVRIANFPFSDTPMTNLLVSSATASVGFGVRIPVQPTYGWINETSAVAFSTTGALRGGGIVQGAGAPGRSASGVAGAGTSGVGLTSADRASVAVVLAGGAGLVVTSATRATLGRMAAGGIVAGSAVRPPEPTPGFTFTGVAADFTRSAPTTDFARRGAAQTFGGRG